MGEPFSNFPNAFTDSTSIDYLNLISRQLLNLGSAKSHHQVGEPFLNCPDTVIGPTSTTYSSPVSTQLLNLGRRFLAAANHAAILINSSNVFQVLHFTVERGQLFPRLAGVALYGGTGV